MDKESKNVDVMALLKENLADMFLPLRIEGVTNSNKLAALALAFNVIISVILAVTLSDRLFLETICHNEPMPIIAPEDATCLETLSRRDYFRVPNQGTIELDLVQPELVDIESLLVPDEQLLEFELVLSAALPDLESSLFEIGDDGLFKFNEFYESLVANTSSGIGDLDFITNISVVEGTDDVLNVEMTYVTAGGDCVLTFQPFVGQNESVAEGTGIVSCTVFKDGKLVFKVNVIREVFDEFSDVVQGFVTGALKFLLQNLHSTTLDANLNPGSNLLLDLLPIMTPFCCREFSLSFFSAFALFSGFVFAFEGLITLFLAVTVFRGRLQQTIPDLDFAPDPSRVSVQRASFQKSLKKSTSKPLLTTDDLKNAVVNPRSASLPYSKRITFLSICIETAICLVAAYFANERGKFEVCQSVSLDAVKNVEDATCDTDIILNFESLINSNDENVTRFGTVTFAQSVIIRDPFKFDLDDLVPPEGLFEQLDIHCTEDTEFLPLFCFDFLDLDDTEFSGATLLELLPAIFGNYRMTAASGKIYTIILDTLIDDDNIVNFQIGSLTDEENEFANLELGTIGLFAGFNALSSNFNTIENTQFALNLLMKEVFGENSNVRQVLDQTEVRCCSLQEIGFLEYFGISIGVLSYFEGFVTLGVAYVVLTLSFRNK